MSAPLLNVYKKIPVVRLSSDVLSYEDIDGNIRSVSAKELGDAIATATPLTIPKVKLDIPVPRIKYVDTYERDILPTYKIQISYVRHYRQKPNEWYTTLEYIADIEDEIWLVNFNNNNNDNNNNTSGNGNGVSSSSSSPYDDYNIIIMNGSTNPIVRRKILSIRLFEHMMDLLEKATAFESIITEAEAETLFLTKLPQLYHTFPSSLTAPSSVTIVSLSSSSISPRGIATGIGGSTINNNTVSTSSRSNNNNTNNNSNNNKNNNNNTNTNTIVTVQNVIREVYNYWVQKRSKLKRPLLRKYWPVTAVDDTNPHLVFRPRNEKEKYKLRVRKRTSIAVETIIANTCKKMKCIRDDLYNLSTVLECVVHRENIHKVHVLATVELFHQRLYDIIDTSGLPRKSKFVNKSSVQRTLWNVPTYYDTVQTGKRSSVFRIRNSSSTSPTISTGGTSHADAMINCTASSGAVGGGRGGGRGTPVGSSSSTTAFDSGGISGHDSIRTDSIRTIVQGAGDISNIEGMNAMTGSSTLVSQSVVPPANILDILPNIAGRNNGEPAPNFLHPLETRESFRSPLNDCHTVPYIRSYVNSQVMPTYMYKQRPRIGRGGRVIIDRLPQEQNQYQHPIIPGIHKPITFRAGKRLVRYLQPKARLLDLLPRPLNHAYLSHAIESISIAAVKEEYDADAASTAAVAASAAAPGTSSMGGVGFQPHLRHSNSTLNISSQQQQQQHLLYPSGSSMYSTAAASSSAAHPLHFASTVGTGTSDPSNYLMTYHQDNHSLDNHVYYNNNSSSNTNVNISSSSSMNNAVAEYDEIIVRVEDYLETDDQLWGEEHYTLGPI